MQLDKDNAHAQNQPEPFSASSGDKTGDAFFGRHTAQEWMHDWGDELVTKLGDYLVGTKFDMPSSFAQWSAGAPAEFATAMWAPVLGKIGENRPYGEIGRIIVPDALDPLVNAGRDAPTGGPLDLLRQSLNGITVAVAQYNNFSMWDKASLVAQQIGFMYLRVASLSEQAVAGQEALAAANDQSKLFPALVMEQVLAEVRRVLHREEGANWHIDTGVEHDSRSDLKEHQDREAKLRLRLARVRDELLQNQEGAAKDLQQLQQDLADLQTETPI